MMVVVKDALDRIKINQQMGVEAAAAVEADINNLLRGKSYDHLVALQKQIQTKLGSGEPIDVDYWEGLLKKLIVWKAKVCCIFVLVVHLSNISRAGETQNPSRSRRA